MPDSNKDPQPLVSSQPIVNGDGTPTQYFIRWAQERQNAIQGAPTLEQVQELIDEWAAGRDIIAGTGLDGGGPLSADVTLDLADTAVAPGIYGDSTHSAQIEVDPQGRIVSAVNIAIAGGGGGGNWWLQPPSAASLALASGDGTLPVLTDDPDEGLLFDGGPPAVSPNRWAYRTLTNPALDWDMKARIVGFTEALNYCSMGLSLQDASGRNGRWGLTQTAFQLSYETWATLTAYNGAPFVYSIPQPNPDWFRITRSGGNYSFYVSMNGKQWTLLYVVAVGAYVGDATKVGFTVNYNRNNGQNAQFSVGYFSLTGPAV